MPPHDPEPERESASTTPVDKDTPLQSDPAEPASLAEAEESAGEHLGDEPAPAGHRRLLYLGAAVALVVVAAAALLFLAPWSTSGCADESGLVNDVESRLCYAAPQGWSEVDPPKEAEGVTSMISSESETAVDTGTIMAGSWQQAFGEESVPEGLVARAEWLTVNQLGEGSAKPGESAAESQELSIGGRKAATAWRVVEFGSEHETAIYLRTLVVEVDDGNYSYVVGMAPDGTKQSDALIEAVDSVGVL